MKRLAWTLATAGWIVIGEAPLAAEDLDARSRQQAAATNAPAEDSTWLGLGRQLARLEEKPLQPDGPGTQPAPAPAGAYAPWRSRRGPAYPGDFWRSFGRDAKELPATLWDDTKATFTNTWSLVGFGAAIGAGIAIDAANGNGCAADHYRKNHDELDKCGDMIGDVGGNPATHFALAGAMYFTTLATNDVRNYEVSKTLLNGLAVNGVLTMALKGICHSDSPNGDPLGWPSGHTSSTFCAATILHEAYGPLVGLPMFAFSAFVGYERIEARNHDFNDVISGALIGMAIGHAVSRNHMPRVLGMEVLPYADPSRGAFGLALARQW